LPLTKVATKSEKYCRISATQAASMVDPPCPGTQPRRGRSRSAAWIRHRRRWSKHRKARLPGRCRGRRWPGWCNLFVSSILPVDASLLTDGDVNHCAGVSVRRHSGACGRLTALCGVSFCLSRIARRLTVNKERHGGERSGLLVSVIAKSMRRASSPRDHRAGQRPR